MYNVYMGEVQPTGDWQLVFLGGSEATSENSSVSWSPELAKNVGGSPEFGGEVAVKPDVSDCCIIYSIIIIIIIYIYDIYIYIVYNVCMYVYII